MKFRMTMILFMLVVALLLAACGGAAPQPETVTVIETVIVEKEVEVIKEVEVPAEEAAEAMGADMSLDPYIIALAGYRTGPFQHTGTPLGNGMQDAATLINQQGGIDGWPVKALEIETAYATPRGVEAYERAATSWSRIAIQALPTLPPIYLAGT